MIPLGGYGRCHPTPLTPPPPSPETLQHTKEEREITKMWFAPKSSSSPPSVAWNVSLEEGERISPEVSRLLMAYLSSPSATFALSDVEVYLRLAQRQRRRRRRRGRDYPRNLDRRQKKRLRRRRKTAARGLALAAWTTQITGDTRMKTFSSPCI